MLYLVLNDKTLVVSIYHTLYKCLKEMINYDGGLFQSLFCNVFIAHKILQFLGN